MRVGQPAVLRHLVDNDPHAERRCGAVEWDRHLPAVTRGVAERFGDRFAEVRATAASQGARTVVDGEPAPLGPRSASGRRIAEGRRVRHGGRGAAGHVKAGDRVA